MVSTDEHVDSAKKAGLRYVTAGDPDLGITRQRAGEGFEYRRANGEVISDPAELERIRKLVIPPAWTDVWICRDAGGHIQVTARDAKGRKQYKYHPDYRKIRDETKFSRMVEFSEIVPKIRTAVERDLAGEKLSRPKVLATVVWLLERTLIRVGNDEYARDNKSYGLTTLRSRHVQIQGNKLRFEFKGKSGVSHSVNVNHKKIARIVQRFQELPGQELFQYLDDDDRRQSIDAADVNAYLGEISGRQATAKDFRTWAGTLLAACKLRDLGVADSDAQRKANVVAAIDKVAEKLGNTRAVCRKYYVHPAVIQGYLDGKVLPPSRNERRAPASSPGLRYDERELVKFLRDAAVEAAQPAA